MPGKVIKLSDKRKKEPDIDEILESYSHSNNEEKERMEKSIHEKLFDFIKKWAKRLGESLIKSIQYLWDAMTDPGVPWEAKSIAISALAYLVSPIDVIPDFLPGGLTDDGMVIAAAVTAVTTILVKHGIELKKKEQDGYIKN